jgi:hypothetical protein
MFIKFWYIKVSTCVLTFHLKTIKKSKTKHQSKRKQLLKNNDFFMAFTHRLFPYIKQECIMLEHYMPTLPAVLRCTMLKWGQNKLFIK